jgi:hypothetical protein
MPARLAKLDVGHFQIGTFTTRLVPNRDDSYVLQAYFDESERRGGTFCVAGYAFVPEQARKFIREWSVLFAATGGCRMVELLARQNRFKGSSETERDRLLREAVKIIKQRISFGVAVSCNVGRGMRITPTWIRGMGAADMLAWEWAKFEDETLALGLRPMRKSLHALVDSSLKQYCGMHITGPVLVNFMYKVTKLGLLQRRENYYEERETYLARYLIVL